MLGPRSASTCCMLCKFVDTLEKKHDLADVQLVLRQDTVPSCTIEESVMHAAEPIIAVLLLSNCSQHLLAYIVVRLFMQS